MLKGRGVPVIDPVFAGRLEVRPESYATAEDHYA
jgi:hypothetical protein